MENQEAKEKRRAQIKKQKITLAVGTIFIIGIVAVVIFKLSGTDISTSAGVKALKEMETVKVAEREKKIDTLEEEDRKADSDYQNRPLKEKFKNAVVMGDSITESLSGYEVLDPASVIAEIGIAITKTQEQVKTVEALSPKYIFLAYGMNDIAGANGDAQIFKGWYKDFLDELKKKLPDTKIYVNSILPVQQKEIDRDPNYAHLDEFNQVLEELCKEEEVSFINNTDLAKAELYEPDGVHMTSAYYPVWAQKMAEAAGL